MKLTEFRIQAFGDGRYLQLFLNGRKEEIKAQSLEMVLGCDGADKDDFKVYAGSSAFPYVVMSNGKWEA